MPSELVLLPVASSMPCDFSSALPIVSKLLKQEMSQCLTQDQMASADLPVHTHRYTRTCTFIISYMGLYPMTLF